MDTTYTNVNGYLIPNLSLPKPPIKSIGIYGGMRRKYLKTYHPAIYSAMMLKGTFLDYLADVEEACQTEITERVKFVAKAQGVTEELKKKDQMRWAGLMNNIQHSVREQVLREFVYTEEGLV